LIGAARQFLDRLKAGVSTAIDLTQMSKWMVQNTTHPKDATQPWSFKDHEMQIGICDASQGHVVVRKCSQIGLSEISVRISLALLSIYHGSTGIYTLPTASYARKFTKARFDPVITGSEYLKSQVPSGNDSSELKQIGTSFLYLVGTSGQSAPISIPADILIRDEVDFSNQKILSVFFSRLGHAKDGGIIRDFSTPTVDGYGVSKTYTASTQGRYMAKCDHCHEYVAPTFFEDAVIPGFDDDFIKLEKEDLENPRIKIDEIFLSCPACGSSISDENLRNPDKRGWVHAYPDNRIGGFQVMPFDVIAVNPLAKTIRSIDNYERKADWVNFELGLPFQDAENSILDAVVLNNMLLEWVPPRPSAALGTVAGLDIGKTSHLTIGRRQGPDMHVLHAEQIRQDGHDNLVTRVRKLMGWYGVTKLVVDAGPDFTTALKLIEKSRVNQVFGCYYVRSHKTKFARFDVLEEDQIVNANKVLCFDRMVKEANAGRIKYARMEQNSTMREHYKAMKTQNSLGETTKAWISTGSDHYAHSLNYLMIADSLTTYVGQSLVIPTLPHIGTVQFGKNHTPPPVEHLLRHRGR
jgi:hypothetical protein